jgi:hypothetical protein
MDVRRGPRDRDGQWTPPKIKIKNTFSGRASETHWKLIFPAEGEAAR